MPETGAAEIRTLEHSFNTMGSSLQASRGRVPHVLVCYVSSPPPTRRAAASNGICTTARSSASSPSPSRCVWPRAWCPRSLPALQAQLSGTATGLAEVVEDLQEIAVWTSTLAVLLEGGPRSRVPRRSGADPPSRWAISSWRTDRRLPEPVEVAAYYGLVSEASTNAGKHSQASVINVEVATDDAVLRLSVSDDGVGGADESHGSGLIGLHDRIESLGGTLEITSTPGNGTSILAKIPIDGHDEAR